jgi:hypothetical protein
MNSPHKKIKEYHQKAHGLKDSDPEGSLMSARKAAEAITKWISWMEKGQNAVDKTARRLPARRLVDDLAKKKLIPGMIATSLGTIVEHSNYGAHDQPDPIEVWFVKIAVTALDGVVDWFQNEYPESNSKLPPAPPVKHSEVSGKNVNPPPEPFTLRTARAHTTAQADKPKRPPANKPSQVTSPILPCISKITDAPTAPVRSTIEVLAHAKKVVHLKPPFTVKDLAAAINLKPYALIKNLMDIGVFANQNQNIEVDVASKICEMHGWHFEHDRGAN